METSRLLSWAPFKVDALGIITLLGSNEIDQTLGRLCTSCITEFLPLVAGHVIATDSIKRPVPGFTVYNITDGICATDVTGWFSRWLLCQDLTYNKTTLTVGVLPPTSSAKPRLRWAAVIGFVASFSMIFLPSVSSDWWGFSNAIALAISVLTRFQVLKANRKAVDQAAESGVKQSTKMVKTLWKMPDGTALAVYTSRGVLTECLLSTPRPHRPGIYALWKLLAWAAFITHILSLGMAALPSQILCIAILGVSSISVVNRFGSDDQRIGTRIQICRFDRRDNVYSMAGMFASLSLSHEEEQSMTDWHIMPLPSNQIWWRNYRNTESRDSLDEFANWKDADTWKEYEEEAHRTPMA